MEKRINKKVDTYVLEFKDNIRNKANEFGVASEQVNHLLQYIYDYEHINLKKDDFAKRKRVKNVVPFFDRCSAKRANNEQFRFNCGGYGGLVYGAIYLCSL